MALVKDRMSSSQSCAYGENLASLYGFDEYHKMNLEERAFERVAHEGLLIKNLSLKHPCPPLGGTTNVSSKEFAFHNPSLQGEEAHSLINFKGVGGGVSDDFIQAYHGSLLSFKRNERISDVDAHKEDHSGWDESLSYDSYHWREELGHKSSAEVQSFKDLNGFQIPSRLSSIVSDVRQEHTANWLYSEATIVADSMTESTTHPDSQLLKRSNKGESTQTSKKQCTGVSATKKPKPKISSPSKDPQSVAAKQRRERISERLKILQELVPNGSKVDLVTMLEKAISYVKFLQLQVKVLATDEFWPAQGGKAPDISQVKDAIDAILSSQRTGISSSTL